VHQPIASFLGKRDREEDRILTHRYLFPSRKKKKRGERRRERRKMGPRRCSAAVFMIKMREKEKEKR